MPIAIADLNLRYLSLRIPDATAEAVLAASLDAHGPREAVLVAAVSPDTTGVGAAWRAAADRPEARDKIADDPLIALRAYEAIRTPSLPRSAPETKLADAMIAVSRAAARARQMVDELVSRDLLRVPCETLEAGRKSASGRA